MVGLDLGTALTYEVGALQDEALLAWFSANRTAFLSRLSSTLEPLQGLGRIKLHACWTCTWAIRNVGLLAASCGLSTLFLAL
jgi:hypothetical protein